MIEITKEYKDKVVAAMVNAEKNYDGSAEKFAKQYSISGAIFSRIKGGEVENILSAAKWIEIGRLLEVSLNERKWNVARTDVFNMIEEDIVFCKEHSKSRICVSNCGIGKTFTAKYLSRSLKNCFYLDASQCKKHSQFIRNLARTIGADDKGKTDVIKSRIKYLLKIIPKPLIIIDEAGDLNEAAFLDLKEFWNATENICGWYLMGARGLKAKISKGIKNDKVGYDEIFSRFSEKYTNPVPANQNEMKLFYKKMLKDVLSANMSDKTYLNELVAKCLNTDETGTFSGLRRAESLLLIYNSSN